MRRNKKDNHPNWRPNFVNPSELPDIKVIRTNFVINIVAVFLALSAITLFLTREYNLRSLEETINRLEDRISEAESTDKNNLKLSREFKKAAEYVVEVGKFSDTPFDTS